MSLTNVRGRIDCPQAPLHFAPSSSRFHGPAHRQSLPVCRPEPPPPFSVLNRGGEEGDVLNRGGEEGDGCFSRIPLPFFSFHRAPLLYSLSLSLPSFK
jgi:hypothetical protein